MTDDDRLAAAYMRALRRAARALSRSERQELIQQIAEHIAEARSRHAEGSSLRDVLHQLGEPRVIAGTAQAEARAARAGRREIAAVLLLLAGGILGMVAGLPGSLFGWIWGVILLWSSPRWRWADKLLGTLVWPGGLFAVFLFATVPAGTCTSVSGAVPRCTGVVVSPAWLGIAVLVVAAAAPILVAVRLLRRARQLPEPAEPDAPRAIRG